MNNSNSGTRIGYIKSLILGLIPVKKVKESCSIIIAERAINVIAVQKHVSLVKPSLNVIYKDASVLINSQPTLFFHEPITSIRNAVLILVGVLLGNL